MKRQYEGFDKKWGASEPLHIKDLKECGTSVVAYTSPPGLTSMDIYSDHLGTSPALQFQSLLSLSFKERTIPDILANLPFSTKYGSNYHTLPWANYLFSPPPIAKKNTFHSLHRISSQEEISEIVQRIDIFDVDSEEEKDDTQESEEVKKKEGSEEVFPLE